MTTATAGLTVTWKTIPLIDGFTVENGEVLSIHSRSLVNKTSC